MLLVRLRVSFSPVRCIVAKVLVTGGAGFIGSHMVDAFLASGYDVAVVDDLSSGKREQVNPRARFYPVDIRNASALAEVFDRERPDFVDHHAAQASVALSVRDPCRDAETNILGSINVFEQARRIGVRKVVYASTGGALYGEPRYLPCDEEHPVHPLSPYGASKYAAEKYLALFSHLHGVRFTVLRYANVYGPRQDPFGEAGVVAIFAQKMLRGGQPVIFGTGEQLRDFVYVGDVAEANLLALERGGGEAFNIGTEAGVSVNQIFALLTDATGYGGKPAYEAPRPGDVFRIYLKAQKAHTALGWAPKVGLEEGLRRTVEFFRGRTPSQEARGK
ncbi:MAG: NAD-dependent epimerase/dehydratase family protein [Chloroflexi bacterium]|nr:NAD-dependent epimerase/dehydratase family protein [Chloroflexota bacterium]